MPNSLHISGCGTSFAILQGRTVLARATSNGNAITALRGLEQRLRQVRIRPCLCCDHPMKSTGPGHRLCPGCRASV